jgi:hypothetical protein
MARRNEELLKWYLLLMLAIVGLWQLNAQKPIMASNTMSFYVVGLIAVVGTILANGYFGNLPIAAVVGFLIYAAQLYLIIGVK